MTDEAGACAELPSAQPLPSEEGLEWYAVWVLSRCEVHVQETLAGMGLETFLPLYEDRVEWSDREKVTFRPLFPGYVFVRATVEERASVLRIAGVVSLLPSSLRPEPVDAGELEIVKRVLESRLPTEPCEWIEGDQIMIERGALAGTKGIVKRTRRGTRVIVKIEMLHRAVSVEIDASDLVRDAT